MRYVHNPDVAWRVIDDEAVLLAIETTTYYSLDPVGTFIWKAFAEGASQEEVLTRVLATYEVDEATARADLDELVGDLVAERLLVPEGDGAEASAA